MKKRSTEQYELMRNLRYRNKYIPRAEPVALRITHVGKPTYWYEKYVGVTVKAMPFNKNKYVVLPFNSEFKFLIDSEDCEYVCHLN